MALKTYKLTWNHGFEVMIDAAEVMKEHPRYRFLDGDGRETASYIDPNITNCEESEGVSHE